MTKGAVRGGADPTNKVFTVFLLALMGLMFSLGMAQADWVWPTVFSNINSDMGPRMINGVWDFHEGVDIEAPMLTDVTAAEAGVVDRIEGSAYKTMSVVHVGGRTSQYLHLSVWIAEDGEEVYSGELIARSGNTSPPNLPIGPHLHFQIVVTGSDPRQFLHPFKYLPYANTGAPTIFSVSPENGEIIWDTITLEARVLTTTDRDLNGVYLFVDHILVNEVIYDPRYNCEPATVTPNGTDPGNDTFHISWDTSTSPNGWHTLLLEVQDAQGVTSQVEWVVYVDNLVGPGGGGPVGYGGDPGCLRPDALIATPTGFQAIQDIKAGDQVMGWDGKKEIATIVDKVLIHDGTWTLYRYKDTWYTGNHKVLSDGKFVEVQTLSQVTQPYQGKVYHLLTATNNYCVTEPRVETSTCMSVTGGLPSRSIELHTVSTK